MATRLIQFAIGLSVLTYITTQDIVSTLSVIVVAGACGLAVGTPIALLASNSKLAKKGIIVKGGIQIEKISNAKTIVFDKTGTLTVGHPHVTQILSFSKSYEPKKILEYAAIAERNVNHPLANAIIEKATAEKIAVQYSKPIMHNEESINTSNNINNNIIEAGKGVSIFHNDRWISAGSLEFIEEQFYKEQGKDAGQLNIDLHCSSCDESINRYFATLGNNYHSHQRGVEGFNKKNIKSNNLNEFRNINTTSSTIIFIALDKEVIGAILLEDKLRNESKETILKLETLGLRSIMLTGDNEHVAKKIAEECGIKEYYANLLPADKVSKIKEIVTSNKNNSKYNKKRTSVIMVGDGINDAPALAESDVGIAMGKSGTDIAIETADVILMTENLTKIHYLINSSRKSIFTIRQNFVGTLFIDGFGFILAFIGLLNPVLAAFIHVSSELIFMINSARLLK